MIFLATLKMVLLAGLGVYFYRRGLIEAKTLEFLNVYVVDWAVPCLIFSRILDNRGLIFANPPAVFIFLSLVLFFLGYLLAMLGCRKSRCNQRSEFLLLVSVQNSGYLPMNLAAFLFPPDLREKFLVFIILYLLGYNLLLWSLSGLFFFRKNGERFRYKELFTPALIATIVGLGLVYSGLSGSVPSLVQDPVRLVGDTSFVFSMLVLGCWLAKIPAPALGLRANAKVLGWISFLKLVVLPLMVFLVLFLTREYSLLGFFILMQSAMPSAASLPIVANMHSGNSEFVSQGVLVTHILSMVTLTFWLALYSQVSGFKF